MATIKNKGKKAKLTPPARAIHSIIVPLRKKNRAPSIAEQDFANRTITLNLFPNVYCSISELQSTAKGILDLFRNITNNDIRYQQRMNALPSFLACRDLCCKFSSVGLNDADCYAGILPNYVCYPYLRVTIDNIHVAVFITMAWCRRTGQLPHRYNVTYFTNGKMQSKFYDVEKSNPYMFEKLLEIKKVHSIKFGAVAEIICSNVDRSTDLYNIPGVRVSQKFGHALNVYAMRKLKEVREELQRGELKRLQILRSDEHKRAVARMVYNERKAWLHRTNMAFSYYGRYQYKAEAGNRYSRAYCRVVGYNKGGEYLTQKTNEALAAIHAPELLKPIIGAEEIMHDICMLEDIARAEQQRRIEVEEKNRELEEANGKKERIFVAKKTSFRNKTQLRNYVFNEASLFQSVEDIDKNCRNVTADEVTKAIETLTKSAAEIEIRKSDGQLIIKF